MSHPFSQHRHCKRSDAIDGAARLGGVEMVTRQSGAEFSICAAVQGTWRLYVRSAKLRRLSNRLAT
jgi:hypothetical protein